MTALFMVTRVVRLRKENSRIGSLKAVARQFNVDLANHTRLSVFCTFSLRSLHNNCVGST